MVKEKKKEKGDKQGIKKKEKKRARLSGDLEFHISKKEANSRLGRRNL